MCSRSRRRGNYQHAGIHTCKILDFDVKQLLFFSKSNDIQLLKDLSPADAESRLRVSITGDCEMPK
jgi:hypothetical protein